jgi:hypothetical protein
MMFSTWRPDAGELGSPMGIKNNEWSIGMRKLNIDDMSGR